jgi:hypothetical protein
MAGGAVFLHNIDNQWLADQLLRRHGKEDYPSDDQRGRIG